VALGRAALLAARERAKEAPRLHQLRDRLAERLLQVVPELTVNGDGSDRAPHVLNVSIAGADSEALLMHLDLAGVAASSGSACSTGSVEPSHVLVAMGVPRDLALGAIRFSFGHESTVEDVDRVAEVMPAVVAKVRQLAGLLGRAAS
jgi:cysteine desulfurase